MNNGISSKILIANITDIQFPVDDAPATGTCEYSFQELKNYIQNGYYIMFRSDAMQVFSNFAYFLNDNEEELIAAEKMVYTSAFVRITIVYTEEGLTIEQTVINNS